MRLSGLADELAPFLAMELMERGMELARQGVDIVQLAVGEPDFPAPAPVIEAAQRALAEGQTHYTASSGLYALRRAVADDCERRRGVAVDPDDVVITSGTSPALSMVLRLLLDPGDEVLIPTPHYPCYPNMALSCSARPVFVPTGAGDGYAIDPAAVKAAVTPRTRAILVASPANPTGAVQPREVVEGLCELGVPVLSDEIYDGLLFDGARVTSPLCFTRECFVFDGFSKRYAMTGFRLGYVIAPPSTRRALTNMQQNLHISAPEMAQHAGVAALERGAPYVETMRRTYAERRGILLEGVRELGLGAPNAPEGAFYILADARHLGADSMETALDLLQRAHVAVAPGRDFGAIAEGHLRFSYATSAEHIREGLSRLQRALR